VEPAGPTGGDGAPRSPAVAWYATGWIVGALPAFLCITLLWLYFDQSQWFGDVAIGAFALMFPIMIARLGIPRRIGFVHFLLLVGLAFGAISIVTGWANGLTDEPFTTPKFAAFTLAGNNPYVTPLIFTYVQYGREYLSESYYLYLPALMFLQIPGISYKWFALGCWAVMVFLVRRRFDTATMLAQPYMVLIAASGYNDLVVLLLLTLGFVGIEGRRQKWAEYLSLGVKQFANVFVFGYYAFQRRWRDCAITLAVSAAFILPFLIWGGVAVICPAVFANRLSVCAAGASPGLLLNYPAWGVWILAVFYVPALLIVRRWVDRPGSAARLARWRVDRRWVAPIPSLLAVSGSAVGLGLSVFVIANVALGSSDGAFLGAQLLAIAAQAAWLVGWEGPWRTGHGPSASPIARYRHLALSQLASAGVALVGFAASVAAGLDPLAASFAGLAPAAVLTGALIVKWDLVVWPRPWAARPTTTS
jgi:hypothetical protein